MLLGKRCEEVEKEELDSHATWLRAYTISSVAIQSGIVEFWLQRKH